MRKRKSEQQRLAVRLDIGITTDLDALLTAECRRLGEDKATVIRIALRAYFAHGAESTPGVTAHAAQP